MNGGVCATNVGCVCGGMFAGGLTQCECYSSQLTQSTWLIRSYVVGVVVSTASPPATMKALRQAVQEHRCKVSRQLPRNKPERLRRYNGLWTGGPLEPADQTPKVDDEMRRSPRDAWRAQGRIHTCGSITDGISMTPLSVKGGTRVETRTGLHSAKRHPIWTSKCKVRPR